MEPEAYGRIRRHPKFAELVQQRNNLARTLTVVMLAIYFGFIFLVAFAGGFVATPISGPITLAFPLGLGVILSAVILTGVYVLRANTEFDTLTRQIVGDALPSSASASATATVTRGTVGASR